MFKFVREVLLFKCAGRGDAKGVDILRGCIVRVIYEGTRLEHKVNGIDTKCIFVSTEELDVDSSVAIASEENFLSVAKLYAEDPTRTLVVCITSETYEFRVGVARACKAGVIFLNDKYPESNVLLTSLSGYSEYKLDEFAAGIRAKINVNRFVKAVVKEVPFSLSREQARQIVSEVSGDDARSALELLQRMLKADVSSFKRLKKVEANDLVKISWLRSVRPGLEANTELLAYANKIYEEGGVHILEAGMGFGKTQHVIRPVLEAAKINGKKSTFLTHRVSISSSFDDVCTQYTDRSVLGMEDKLSSLALVVNSASHQRFQLHTEQSDVLIIDEGSQVLSHILQKGFKGDRRGVFHELVKIIKSTRLVLVADAFISDILTKFLCLSGREVNFKKGVGDNSQSEIHLAEVETVQRLIVDDITEGKKVMIGLDSKKEAEALASYIRKQGKKTLLVTQKTRGYPEVSAFFKCPNLEIKKYDALVYSPSMQSSISITERHFDSHYCMFFGVVGVDDARQFTRRDRTCQKVTVGVSKRIAFQLDRLALVSEFYSSGDHDFDSIAIPFYRADAKEKNNLRKNLALAFELDGYKIFRVMKEGDDAIASKVFRAEKSLVTEHKIVSTIRAAESIVDNANFDAIIIPVTEDQVFHNDALAVSRGLGKKVSDLTQDDIRFYGGGSGITKLMNARCCFLGDVGFGQYAEHAEVEKGRDHKSLGGRRKFLRKFMELLGVRDGNEVLENVAMQAAAEFAVRSRELLVGYGIVGGVIRCRTINEISAAVSVVLRSMGLSKVRVKRAGKHVYVLSGADYLRMISYVDAGRQKEVVTSRAKCVHLPESPSFFVRRASLKPIG